MLFDLNTAPKQEQVVPVTACRVTTGVGKTRILIEVIADIIKSVRVQPVDATQALNLCAGAWKFKVFRGRSLS
jgi:hypothetical protein